jgi:hypothetical protein
MITRLWRFTSEMQNIRGVNSMGMGYGVWGKNPPRCKLRFPAFSLKAHLQTLYQLCRHTYSATPNAGLVRLRSPNAPQRPDFFWILLRMGAQCRCWAINVVQNSQSRWIARFDNPTFRIRVKLAKYSQLYSKRSMKNLYPHL